MLWRVALAVDSRDVDGSFDRAWTDVVKWANDHLKDPEEPAGGSGFDKYPDPHDHNASIPASKHKYLNKLYSIRKR